MNFAQGRLDGPLTFYGPPPLDSPLVKETFKEGMLHGTVEVFSPKTQKLVHRQTLRDGLNHGAEVAWDQDTGNEVGRANYADGLIDGPIVRFAPDGKTPTYRATAVKGALDGLEEVFDPATGVLRSKVSWKAGKRHGPSQQWDEAGRLVLDDMYDEAGQLLGEYDANGRPVYETIYLASTPVGALKRTGSAATADIAVTVYNVYADQIDTPRVITRQDHAIVWRWDTAEAFGATAPDQDPNALGVFVYHPRFPGQVFDAETGLFQNWHREYNSRWGRYAQSDPIGLAGGINTFAYVSGNPLSVIDPTGEFGIGGALFGAGLELAIQAYKNYSDGCDVLDIDNYDWWDVGVSAAVGAVAPGALNVGKGRGNPETPLGQSQSSWAGLALPIGRPSCRGGWMRTLAPSRKRWQPKRLGRATNSWERSSMAASLEIAPASDKELKCVARA